MQVPPGSGRSSLRDVAYLRASRYIVWDYQCCYAAEIANGGRAMFAVFTEYCVAVLTLLLLLGELIWTTFYPIEYRS